MMADNLRLLLALYVRPRAALSAIVDEGSLLFAAMGVIVTSILPSLPTYFLHADAFSAAAAQVEEHGVDPASLHLAFAGVSLGSVLLPLAGLALLYVPGLIFLMTLIDRRAGSFGVALARDYGSVAACAMMAWTASRLPFIVLGGALLLNDTTRAQTVLWFFPVAAIPLFVTFMILTVRTVYGVAVLPAFSAALLACVMLPLQAYLALLASPFLLYYAYLYFSGDIRNIEWSLGSRRSFKRHLEAATINPRDAEAHYQLGLIHQHRRQYAEAIARFEKAIEIDAGEIDAHFQLGRIAREQGRHAEAIRHFEPVVARDPKHSRYEVWREVGGTYVEAGDFANARPMLERYVENRPYDPEGLYLLGLTLKKLGETEKAGELLHRCVEATTTAPDYRRSELRRWRKLAQAEL